MNILFRVVALVLMSSSYFSVAYAVDGSGDTYEQEADRVAGSRPSPIMRKGKNTTQMRKGVKGQAATSAKRKLTTKMKKKITGKSATSIKGKVNTGAGASAINGDDCNPLCGMKGVGKEQSQPAQ